MNLAAEPQFPTKWPFPPAPPARRAWGHLLSPFRRARRDGALGVMPLPGAFPASPASLPRAGSTSGAVPGAISGTISGVASGAGQDVTLRQMVVDILLVAMWGAMIPALMWLGAAAGF
ncbi:hypothetical protein [Bordetella genomosp. 11]|uniref:Uncharacterized protein n=1 Tax=Bordetella genomosp. 11 TaxID=1416808 RepID=A0A261UJT0_9BORD|nr:hypothetical protein [Bordetella genomosp. 11]OZI61510.1 hypothetical protein CAL28_19680 [Bordetella genomosp. 11]